MDGRQEEYFIAIAEEGSLSRAARRLYVSQSSLSQYLSKLEERLDRRVIIRGREGVLSLTAAGQIFLDGAYEICRVRDDMRRRLSDLDENAAVDLYFGMSAGHGAHIFAEVLRALAPEYPNVHVETRRESADELGRLVAGGQIDVAFSAFDEKRPGLEYLEFPSREVLLVMSLDHPLARLGTPDPEGDLPHLPLERFAGESFALLRRGSVLRRVQDACCSAQGVKLDVKIETDDIATALSVAENGAYVALCPYDPVPDKGGRRLSWVGLEPPVYYRTGLYYRRGVYQTRFLRDFLRQAGKLAGKENE